jgi:predicted regulator of Ras-like GTPase activity (Roadblock/LC7/MglB family)
MNESHRGTFLNKLLRVIYSPRENAKAPLENSLESLLEQVIQRRPYITALALISPGGQLWASALPNGVEAESVAAMAAPIALLGQRVALEQLKSDMRQAYVEGEGGYAILRSIGQEAVLLTTASADANLALVLHDVDSLESHVSEMLEITTSEVGKWSEAATSIEHLRRLVSDRPISEVLENRQDDLRAKLNSLDMGFYQKRVTAIRNRLQDPRQFEEIEDLEDLEEIEAELLALEKDVMAALEREMVPATEQENRQNSPLRRTLKWLTSTIESKD